MVKTVLSVSHQGMRDWFVQRVTAVVMALYVVGMACFFLTHLPLDYATWQHLFANPSMKIITLIFIGALLWHSWVGMWTVFTDYVRPAGLNIMLNVLMFFALVSSFLWALEILWKN